MKRLKFGTALLVVAFTVGLLSTAAASAGPADTSVSIGDFAVRLAKSLDLPQPPGGFTAESASLALWKAGVKLPAEHKRSLTEGDVVSTLTQIGFNLSTNQPERQVSGSKADSIIQTFVNAAALASTRRGGSGFSVIEGGNGGDDFNNGNGKGGKFKRKTDQSPSSSDD